MCYLCKHIQFQYTFILVINPVAKKGPLTNLVYFLKKYMGLLYHLNIIFFCKYLEVLFCTTGIPVDLKSVVYFFTVSFFCCFVKRQNVILQIPSQQFSVLKKVHFRQVLLYL